MSTEALADVFVQALNCGTAHRSVTPAQVETLAASHQPEVHVKQGSTHVMLLSTLDCGDAECTDARRRANDAEAAVESMQAVFEQRFDAMTRRMEASERAAEQAAERVEQHQQQAQQQAAEFQRCVREIQQRTALATWHAEQRAVAEREWRRLQHHHAFVVADGNRRLEAFQAQLETVTAQLETATAHRAAANTERAELAARLDAANAAANTERAELTARLGTVTARLGTVTARLGTVTAELAEQRAKLEATTQDLYNEMADARLYALARYGEVQLALVVGKWIARCKKNAGQCKQLAQATLAAAFTDTSALESAMCGLQRLVRQGITKIVADEDRGGRPMGSHELRLLRLCRKSSAHYVQVKQLALAEMFPDGAVNTRNWHDAMAAWCHFGGFRGRMQYPTPFEPDIAKLRACISSARFDREVDTQDGHTVTAGGRHARDVMRCLLAKCAGDASH